VDGQLVQEGGGDVEAILNVAKAALRIAHVVVAGHDGVLGAGLAAPALEQLVNHATATGNVLLRGGSSTT
jgi:hypothetical protein